MVMLAKSPFPIQGKTSVLYISAPSLPVRVQAFDEFGIVDEPFSRPFHGCGIFEFGEQFVRPERPCPASLRGRDPEDNDSRWFSGATAASMPLLGISL